MLPLGSVISVFALMMVSLAQQDQAYQIFLSHGVLFGFGIALLFVFSFACSRAYLMSCYTLGSIRPLRYSVTGSAADVPSRSVSRPAEAQVEA